ncbi:MAG: hypothetical protein GEEBNDBF_02650 [bacterium]|nr:hypothetical protein [bacterium]
MIQLPQQFKDDEASLRWLAAAAASVLAEQPAVIHLDARQTTWISAHLCAGLGALKRLAGAGSQGQLSGMSSQVAHALSQIGFTESFTEDRYHTSIQYRVWDSTAGLTSDAAKYLLEGFVRNELPTLTQEVREPLLASLCEVFSNVDRHAQSAAGCLASGQHYPNVRLVGFSVCDLGVTIPGSVQQSRQDRRALTAVQALDWALQRGFSSLPEIGGIGLPDVAAVVRQNGGRLCILSGLALYMQDGDAGSCTSIADRFPGTLVVLELRTLPATPRP